jgi:hypothetical protein
MASQTTVPAAEQTTAYHWIITVQTPNGLFATLDDTIDVPFGARRQEIYRAVLKHAQGMVGDRLNVLYFALEPDRL